MTTIKSYTDKPKRKFIDVMTEGGEKFFCTVIYRYMNRIDIRELENFIFSRYPSLKYRNDV